MSEVTSPPDVAALAPGTEVASATLSFDRDRLVRYAGAAGDFNPIHYRDAAAQAIGLPGVVAHGMLTMGAALSVLTDWVGDPARVRSYSTKFVRPVVVEAATGAEVDVSIILDEVVEAVASVTLRVSCGGEKVLSMVKAEVDLG